MKYLLPVWCIFRGMRKLQLQVIGLVFCVLASAMAAIYFLVFSHEHQLSGGITFLLCTGLYLWSITSAVSAAYREGQASAYKQMAENQPALMKKQLHLN